MKVQLLSDLHNELYRHFGSSPPGIDDVGADLIVLAGDIDVHNRGIDWAAEQSQRLGVPVVYVAGNHEHYDSAIDTNLEQMRERAQAREVHLLENDCLILNGVRFLGCTLWSDFDIAGTRHDSMMRAQYSMNDYALIRLSAAKRLLEPDDTLHWHRQSLAWLQRELATPHDGPTVVVTHHGPSRQARHPNFPLGPLTGAFISDLNRLMGPPIDVWAFGHTHASLAATEQGTRLLSNQRGYPSEDIPGGFDPGFCFEV